MSKRKPTPPPPKPQPKRRPSIIEAQQDSTCFSDLFWQNGLAVATFARTGTTYEYEMTRREFKDWIRDDSLGSYFNEEIR